MTRIRGASRALIALAIAFAGLGLSTISAPAASTGFCSVGSNYPGTLIRWTGLGDGTNWEDANNWSPRVVPDAGHQPGTYQKQYVCIGAAKTKTRTSADVQILRGDWYHVAGLDLGQGARLTVRTSHLLLGALDSSVVVPSFVRAGSALQVTASRFGGNSPLHVSGTLRLTGRRTHKGKYLESALTSSECVPTPAQDCSSTAMKPSGGRTIIGANGRLLIDGSAYGGVGVLDQETIVNNGLVRLTNVGYLAMDNGTSLIDAHGSLVEFAGSGGIYQGNPNGDLGVATISQTGAIDKTTGSFDVVGVHTTFMDKPRISISAGGLSIAGISAPRAHVARGAAYGTGSCVVKVGKLCRNTFPTPTDREVAIATTSSSLSAPKTSTVRVALEPASAAAHGDDTLGSLINVTGPATKPGLATRLTFKFDARTPNLPNQTGDVAVYRGPVKIPRCGARRLTSSFTSCLLDARYDISMLSPHKGDLYVVVRTIRATSRWRVS